MPVPSAHLDHIRHTLSHLLAHAVLEQFPDAKPAIGPTIEDGFYYDFDLGHAFTPQDLVQLEQKMRKVVKRRLAMTTVPAATLEQADQRLAKNPYKRELFDELRRQKATITFYKIGTFTDLCRGGHVDSTAEIPIDAFRLTKVAGAYWHGDSTKPMLQRIYGVAFDSKAELDAYLTQQAEAAKRDHKKLGVDLDLFTFSDLVGSGLPLWTPKGTLLRNLLDDYVWELRQAAGYEKVEIPHITKRELYERSGHWQKFHDELFNITTREQHHFAMKPMNCPHHTQIYARTQQSYRDLPQRYANTTMCYRDEQSGELSGLSRVRAFTQDDAHVFCRESQAVGELRRVWKIVKTFYKAFGFTLRIRLSLHDPQHPEKYLGEPERWKRAEQTLRRVVEMEKATVHEGLGEAAFYGPKIDFMATDSLGREWQVATIQLDLNMPERFDLTCVNEKGHQERIVMIHAAIMGSIERFLSILIEHHAGAFPAWLAPVQVAVIPVGKAHVKPSQRLAKTLGASGLRVHVDGANETVGYKIRKAEKMKVPYMLVIGDKEAKSTQLHVRIRGRKAIKLIATKKFIAQLQTEIAKRTLTPKS